MNAKYPVIFMCVALLLLSALLFKMGQPVENPTKIKGTIAAEKDSVVLPGFDELLRMPDGEIENVLLTMFFHDSVEAMEKDAMDRYGYELVGADGYSACDRNVEKNIAWCDVHIPRPRYVDGYNAWTLGHEALHGVYGERYHR